MSEHERLCNMLGHISFLWLYVGDLERSIKFYNETLGLKQTGKWHEGATFAVGELTLGLHTEEAKVIRGNSPIITFNVKEGIEKVYHKLRERGVKFLGDISEETYGKVVSFEDPDGHKFLIHQTSEEE